METLEKVSTAWGVDTHTAELQSIVQWLPINDTQMPICADAQDPSYLCWILTKLNKRASSHVKRCYRTFPIMGYIKENMDGLSDTVYKKLEQYNISLFLACFIDPITPKIWCDYYFDMGSKKGKNLSFIREGIDFVHRAMENVREQIDQEDIDAECKHLFDFLTNVDLTKTKKKTDIKKDLFHPCEDIIVFRSKCKGRAWFPPHIYSFLYCIYHLPVHVKKECWKTIPRAFARHTQEDVLAYLNAPPTKQLHLNTWNHMLDDIPHLASHPSIKQFNEFVFEGRENKEATRQFLTLGLGRWSEFWTKRGWCIKRSCTKKLITYQQQHVTTDQWVSICSGMLHYFASSSPSS